MCQKSKINDWVQHFKTYYGYDVTDYPKEKKIKPGVVVVNYDTIWRRKEFLQLHNVMLILDESSLICNETAKRTKFIMKLDVQNVILLSGTICSGKYENLLSQINLLGWDISRNRYDATYVNWTLTPDDGSGVRHKIVDKDDPYKNVDRLKAKLREHGAVFLKTEEVIDLPEQNFINVMVDAPKEYKKFMKDSIVQVHTGEFDHECDSEWDGKIYDDLHELIGDTLFTKRLYARQLCSQYNRNKIDALKDLIQSTSDRLIVFYNFNAELDMLKGICDAHKRPYSQVNGSVKDLYAYEEKTDSVTLVQFQAGAMGLNLQKCNKIIYFSLPDRSELFEQSKKRIHRIGQSHPCFYYIMMARNTIDEQIKTALDMRKDLTDYLFEEGE